ncbi:MAG: hypothetical protein IPN42_19200 [Methylococcaceae bacterium]|nr:hypothetical protein [Methylococcaceae bacterium]
MRKSICRKIEIVVMSDREIAIDCNLARSITPIPVDDGIKEFYIGVKGHTITAI